MPTTTRRVHAGSKTRPEASKGLGDRREMRTFCMFHRTASQSMDPGRARIRVHSQRARGVRACSPTGGQGLGNGALPFALRSRPCRPSNPPVAQCDGHYDRSCCADVQFGLSAALQQHLQTKDVPKREPRPSKTYGSFPPPHHRFHTPERSSASTLLRCVHHPFCRQMRLLAADAAARCDWTALRVPIASRTRIRHVAAAVQSDAVRTLKHLRLCMRLRTSCHCRRAVG
ncbi:hypothetical protein BD413DRAFT_89720 [Trametes elegans]|nr:hypothetical protein BD413DRAFT_89720 [Trametes elegans]